MPRAMNEASLRHLGTLFGGGSGLGMSDGQLLERFVTREGTRAERAFEILVERHGPMVLRVARSIVNDRDLADDAFQAVFLALARRARSLWVRDSIGPWLHAVTVRVATRMRADQARRRRIDKRAACLMPSSFEPSIPDDLGAALHEEIARLPEAQRLPIVLCLVEGLTHDQAADRLGWPVGTIRSRLARGRERLRSRLDRRGLAPSPGVLIGPGLLMRSGSEAIRGSLLHATVQNAVSATQGGVIGLVGTVPAGAIAAAVTLVKESSMIHRVATIGLVGAGVFVAGMTLPAQSKQEKTTSRIVYNEVIESNTRRSIARIYHVGDLVLPDKNLLRYTGRESGPLLEQVSGQAQFGPLMDLLTSSVAPGTWTVRSSRSERATLLPESADKPIEGTMTPFTLNLCLVVRHTPEVHDQLVERLRQLRTVVGALTGSPEVVETRVSGREREKQVDQVLDFTVPPEVVEERIIGPEPADAEIVEERIVGPEPAGEVTTGSNKIAGTAPDDASSRLMTVDVDLTPSRSGRPQFTSPDQRIESLERKLDAILDELRAIRKTDE